MTLYVVTEGDYSAYHIVGIYSTKEKAEKVKKYNSGLYDHPDIEEWKLDDVPEDIDEVRDYYNVHYYPLPFFGQDPGWTCRSFTKVGKDNISDCSWILAGDAGFVIDIPCDIAKDEQHAIKIAQDKLAEIKAMKEGI